MENYDNAMALLARQAGSFAALKTAMAWTEINKAGVIEICDQNIEAYEKVQKQYLEELKSRGQK